MFSGFAKSPAISQVHYDDQIFDKLDFNECVPLTISYHLYFSVSLVSSMLHHGSVRRVDIKECYFTITKTFLAYFCCFSSKNLSFYYFRSFFDEVSNFCNRLLTNQKPKHVIINCQCNCLLWHNLNLLKLVDMLFLSHLFKSLQSWTKYLTQTLVSYEMEHCRRSSISIFQGFFASIKNIFILGGRMSIRL